MLFDHYSLIPNCLWEWIDFTPKEVACRGDGSILLAPHAMDSLQLLRNLIGKPLIINSAYRSPLYNARVGGAPLSRHKKGDAFDVSIVGHNKFELYKMAVEAGFTGFGLNYNTFIHVDKGPRREW